jgi:hypothetical protein
MCVVILIPQSREKGPANEDCQYLGPERYPSPCVRFLPIRLCAWRFAQGFGYISRATEPALSLSKGSAWRAGIERATPWRV